jgi:tetratricopeptide (TPR) repeat protein
MIAYGRELHEAGQLQEALKQFTKAMQVAPGSADAKQNAGWTNFKLKNYQSATALLRAALAIDKANPEIYKRLGIVYRDMGDTSSACSVFKQYLAVEPDAPDKADFQSCF